MGPYGGSCGHIIPFLFYRNSIQGLQTVGNRFKCFGGCTILYQRCADMACFDGAIDQIHFDSSIRLHSFIIAVSLTLFIVFAFYFFSVTVISIASDARNRICFLIWHAMAISLRLGSWRRSPFFPCRPRKVHRQTPIFHSPVRRHRHCHLRRPLSNVKISRSSL